MVPYVRSAMDTAAPLVPDLLQFDRELLLEKTSETSANVSIGDINGDGKLDILLVKGRHWPLVSRILLGDGRGGFPTAYNVSESPFRSYSGCLVDLDQDGDLDIALCNDKPDPKVTFINDGKGKFKLGSSFGSADWVSRNASVSDTNGDHLPDIVVANRPRDGFANYICLNKGKGMFEPSGIEFSNEPTTTITPADFNGDGFVDLAVPHRNGGQSYVYVAGAKGTFSRERRIAFGPADSAIRASSAADFNRDGQLDLIAIDEMRGVVLYFGHKDGGFSEGFSIEDGKVTPYALAVEDLNNDGKMDVIVGHVEAASTVHFNVGAGREFSPVSFGDDKGVAYGFAIADLDGDGMLDIAEARSDAPNVVYFGRRKN